MTATTKLALELLANAAANQTLANTTFAQLNQLVQPAVVDKDLATPPGSPANEALYIVAGSPTGAWSGKAGQLAYWLTSTNAWQFIVPREGFLVHVNDENDYYKYDGSAWAVFNPGAALTNPMTTLGDMIVGGASGVPTRLAAGTEGQVQTILGGAPAWADPAGVANQSGNNLLINGDFALNQRGFAGGARTAGVYGHDRWGAYNGGANWSVSAGVVTLTSGIMCQVIESPGLAGSQITVSVEDPSGTIAVTIGNGTGSDSATGNITTGSGRRSVTLTVPAGVTGDLKVRLAATSVTFKRVKAELGATASAWVQPDRALEIQRCSRYCYLLGNTPSFAYVGLAASTTIAYIFIPAFMRALPSAVGVTGAANASAATLAGTVTNIYRLGEGIVRLTVTVASGLVAGNASGLGVTTNAHLDAEIVCTD